MTTRPLRIGSQRYLHGDVDKPITVIACWEDRTGFSYVNGHHAVFNADLVDFLPEKPIEPTSTDDLPPRAMRKFGRGIS